VERIPFLSGNEAIARGAVRAGLGFACGYPGTPSTEVIEELGRLEGPIVEWCINEKVALETAIGASLAGARSLATMKHVGLNVAADPFMTLALTGVNAGLVVFSADDPGMHSSQNEQDNRTFARFARVPMLEPSDSQEAYDFVAEAFELSEEFDTPVLLRSTTRVAHGRGRVVPRVALRVPERGYASDITKYVMVPEYARERNRLALARLERLRSRSEVTPLNVLEAGTADFGIISSGVAYSYAREAFPKAWFLKLGMSHPLPHQKIAKLYSSVSRVFVVEELDPFIEDQVRGLGLPVVGKEVIPSNGELDQEIVFRALEPALKRKPARRRRPAFPPLPVIVPRPAANEELPVRPPVLCPGCSHRAVYAMLRRQKVAVMGDIGCYTLGALPPLLALESCLCMGASVGMMAGINRVAGRIAAVAVIGDSTFFHSGITPLIDARYNETPGLVIVLDNRTTAMTGHQGHPGTGVHPDRSSGPGLAVQALCEGIGVPCLTIDAFEEERIREVLRRELTACRLSVLVASAPCALLDRVPRAAVLVDDQRCNLCGLCIDLGCPAIVSGPSAIRVTADCTACGVCIAVCARGALSLPGEKGGPAAPAKPGVARPAAGSSGKRAGRRAT
jgi:indolepyruvate ferredoxin oxidoreductase, alpha subunit